MGLLDGLLSAALGGSTGTAAPQGTSAGAISPELVMQVLGGLLQQHGGVAGLVNTLNQGGLGQIVSSWVATGQNLPVSPGQVSAALGPDTIARVSQQLGLGTAQTSGVLAQALPHLVDHLTPNGQLPASSSVQSQLAQLAMGALKSKLFG